MYQSYRIICCFIILYMAFIPINVRSEIKIAPATLCKASDASVGLELKSRETGLENASGIQTIEVVCPLPVLFSTSDSENPIELIDISLSAIRSSADSEYPECALTTQVGLKTLSNTPPYSNNSQDTSTDVTWENISYENNTFSSYVISCLLEPKSIIESIKITIKSAPNEQSLILGQHCAGASNPLVFDEDTTFLRYLGNDISLSGPPLAPDFTLFGELNGTLVKASFNMENSNHAGSLKLEVGSIIINGWFTKGRCSVINLEDTPIEKLSDSNVVNLSQLDDISLFRSSAGHDASDDFENCRSMKHYLEPIEKVNLLNAINAPISGIVVSLANEEGGGFVDDGLTNQRISIKSESNPAYEVTLYHVDIPLENALSLGEFVAAGQFLGYGRLVRVNSDDPLGAIADASNDFDISVSVGTTYGTAKISYFQILSDNVFDEYRAWNSKIVSRETLVISKAQRDLNPLQCNGEQFSNASEDPLPRWISEI